MRRICKDALDTAKTMWGTSGTSDMRTHGPEASVGGYQAVQLEEMISEFGKKNSVFQKWASLICRGPEPKILEPHVSSVKQASQHRLDISPLNGTIRKP